MKTKHHNKRYNFYIKLFKILLYPFVKLIYHFKPVNKYKIKKGENVFVLSNHQTDIDPIFIQYAFNKAISPVATETIFSNVLLGKFIAHTTGTIPKRKGETDQKATISIYKRLKSGGNILLFPEGNRTVAEFQFFISDKLASFIKKSEATLILYNMHGGMGILPRFAGKKRKGKLYGEIKRVLTFEEYSKLSDEELIKIIKETIKVYDSDENIEYQSKRSAEYLERVLFVCPKCHQMNTIYSKKDEVICHRCGLTVKYKNNLRFESNDKEFSFIKLNDWYQFQKRFIKEYDFKEDLIFKDKDVTLFESIPYKKRKKLSSGDLLLYKERIVFENYSINLNAITSVSIIGGKKFSFSTENDSFLVVGNKRFNPFKYAFLFNKLDTALKVKQTDNYFNLEEDL